jgi:MFS family permease
LVLLLAGPLMVDLLASCFLFWMNLGAVNMKILPHTQMLIAATFALGYTFGAHYSGKWVKSDHAPKFVLISTILLTIEGTIALLVPSFPIYLVLALLMGLTLSHYFMPFQVMMGDVSPFHTLAWTVAIYTISWGTGWASGPLIAGFLGQVSPIHVAVVAWGLAISHSIIVLVALNAPRKISRPIHPHAAFTSTPTMRLIGSTSVCMVIVVTSGLGATLWLGLGVARSFSDPQIGGGVAAIALPVPILAMFWARCRNMMHRPWLMVGGMILGAVAVAILPLTQTYIQAMSCLATIGIMGSVMFYHGVYYANAAPESKGPSVARYESVVGLGQLLGPALLGLIAWQDATAYRAYGFCSALLLATAIWIVIIYCRSCHATKEK